MNLLTIVTLIIILIMSIITYMAYAIDKRKAQQKKWRIKEHTLLTLSFLGGACGGLFAMYGIRHKNKKSYFVIINFGSLVLHLVLLYLAINN